MKKTFTIFLIICLVSCFSVQANASYRDIHGHWAEESINQAVNWGLISGYPDGTFSPDKSVTLAELLSMLVPLVSGEKLPVSEEDEWYTPYVTKAFELGLLEGFTPQELEGLYDTPVMRAVANALFSNSLVALGLSEKYSLNNSASEKAKLGLMLFSDVDDFLSNLFLVTTYSCVSHELVMGNEKKQLQPYSYLTRAEAVTMLRRVKAYQTKRINGMHYADPFSYSDYHFSCVKTASGITYPIAGSDRPIAKDNGIIYMSTVTIAKIMEACEMDFVVHLTTPDDVYYGIYESYISVPSEDFYAHINTDESFYGSSNTYSGYISGPDNKKYEFSCGKDTDKGLVVRNIPMLPVEDVLDHFEIPYKSVTLSPGKGSIIVDFSNK